MKNSQKGFIVPVLLVVIALLVIGGGVYVYQNKKTETPTVNTETPQSNQTQQTDTQQNKPSNSSVSVKLLSPNGGETFKIGDKISIKWTSTNNVNKKVMLGLTAQDDNTIVKEITNYLEGIPDTGSYSWTIDKSVLPGNYKIVVQTSERPQYAYDASDAPFTISAGTVSNLPGSYKNTNYNVSVNYSENLWVPATDVGMYLLNKETNFEKLLILVKKTPQNGKQCTDANSEKTVSCNSQLESIKFAVINKPIDEVKTSIPSYALTGYDGHTGYNSTCAPLNLAKYSGIRPSACAFSGFEWDEHAEYFYSLGNKTLVVNWNYYDVDKSVYITSEKNFLDVMSTFKLGN